ncbi:MAG: transglycosylase SLT domain-containing protein [Acidithiobacillus sp.]|nr:transglycosylase SLT domain-containing protein [Acidithiobacillus sp.]
MLACIADASTAYHVPVPAIERVLNAVKSGQGTSSTKSASGLGPMGIPLQWLPILVNYRFPENLVRHNACWGIAAGTWILAVEKMYAHGSAQIPPVHGHYMYPPSLPAIPEKVIQAAHQAARKTGVPASMLLAVAAQESGFDPNVVSPTGAQGLMQFEPQAWAHYGHGSPFNPQAAMLAGAQYLRHLALEFHSWPLALAGYNAGGQAVKNAGYRIPPFRQTQNYVPAVLGYYQKFSAEIRIGAEKHA